MPSLVDFSKLFATINIGNHYETYSKRVPETSTIAYFGVTAVFCYYLLISVGILPFALFHAWNAIVFIIPSRLVFALDKTVDPSSNTYKSRQTLKSEAMQRILGLGSPSLLSSFPGTKNFPSISQAVLRSSEINPPGLGNWDNSCYQNSIIQGLAALRSVDKFLEHNIQRLGDHGPLTTHSALKDTLDKLNSPLQGGRRLWTPAELKSMCSWQQQDAQEYFSKVVDQLDKELREASKGLAKDMGLELNHDGKDVSKPIISLSPDNTEVNETQNAAEIKDRAASLGNPLEGLLAQRVGCMNCGWTEGLSLIPFNCLTVSLGRNWEYDIRQCLDDYTALEPIEGVECGKCTLQRAQTQLEQLIGQIDADSELGSDSSDPRLVEALKGSAGVRLNAVNEALQNDDFSEKTLVNSCHIPSKNRVSSTKSRQAVIARAPTSLAIHVNRSVFDELTGFLRKNHADVRFPKILNMDKWCLGTEGAKEGAENWSTNPNESMIPNTTSAAIHHRRLYELRAVVTHYGRHENGHYICYRKYPADSFPAKATSVYDGEKRRAENWFRLSDEDVSPVSESCVLSQGGVFMLFYELVEGSLPDLSNEDLPPEEKEKADEIDNVQDGVSLNAQDTSKHVNKQIQTDKVNETDVFKSVVESNPGVVDGSSPSSSEVSDEPTMLNDKSDPIQGVVSPSVMRTAMIPNEDEKDPDSGVGSSFVSSSMVTAR